MRVFLASRGIVLPDKRKLKSGDDTPPTSGVVTPGSLGAPNGVALNVPPVELAVKGVNASLHELKKEK